MPEFDKYEPVSAQLADGVAELRAALRGEFDLPYPSPSTAEFAAAVRYLRDTNEGEIALRHLADLLWGPNLDPVERHAVLVVLLTAWHGRMGTVLDSISTRRPEDSN